MNQSGYRRALIVEYDGGSFAGYQLQDGVPTIQGELERALATILREPVRTTCAGRTDAGVHSVGQVVSFVSKNEPPENWILRRSMNGLLPNSISVRSAMSAPLDFHPRFTCYAREYDYVFWRSSVRPAIWRGRTHWVYTPLPIDELNVELAELQGEHDFQAFTRHEHRDKVTIRYMHRAQLLPGADCGWPAEAVVLRVCANAFLHNMIRILAGALQDRGEGRLERRLIDVIASRTRLAAGRTAPPEGLYFRAAYYPRIAGMDDLASLPDFPVRKRSAPPTPAIESPATSRDL